MAIQDINTLKGKFADDKEPNGSDFGDFMDSYLHKSTKINQAQVLGLDDSLNDKASKEDLQNAVIGTNLLGTKENVAEIKAITDPEKGDTYKAADTGHYWKYNAVIDANNPYNPDNWLDIGEILPSDASLSNIPTPTVFTNTRT